MFQADVSIMQDYRILIHQWKCLSDAIFTTEPEHDPLYAQQTRLELEKCMHPLYLHQLLVHVFLAMALSLIPSRVARPSIHFDPKTLKS